MSQSKAGLMPRLKRNNAKLTFTLKQSNYNESMIPFGVAKWFELGTSMLEVSGSTPLASEFPRLGLVLKLVQTEFSVIKQKAN